MPPRWVRIAYGVSDVGASTAFVAVNAWLLYLLVNAAGVPPAWAAGVFVAGRALDAFLDPAVGWWGDRLAPRFGRLRFVRWGAVPTGLALAALFAVPPRLEDGAAVAALALFALTSLAYTLVQVPVLALTPELAPGYQDRTELGAWRAAFGTVASLVATALPPALVLLGEGGGGLAQAGAEGWTLAGVVLGTVVTGAYLTTGLLVPEPVRAQRPVPVESPFAAVRSAWTAPGMRTVVASFALVTVGLMVTSSVLPFVLESALLLPASWLTPVLGGFFGIGVAAFPFWTRAADAAGKGPTLAWACVVLAASLAALAAFAPEGRLGVGLWLPAATAGWALAGALLMPWAMLPDVVEFEEARSGVRREGTVVGLFTFVQKLAGSAGVFATGMAAAWTGYRPGMVEQSDATVIGLRLALGVVAPLAFLAAAWVASRGVIDRDRFEATVRSLRSDPMGPERDRS
ncbi:MAG: MFS transporter [Trueperaceae bacterium]